MDGQRAVEGTFRRVRDAIGGEPEWEFPCECGIQNCDESIFLTLDAYASLRDRGEPVLADRHHVGLDRYRLSQHARARRLRDNARALIAQAKLQVNRASRGASPRQR